MIRKRKPAAAEVIEASADNLPFDDKRFDASMAILTIHHWPDKEAGLREMRRVTRGRIVLLTFDPAHRPWLTDYLPELAALDEAQMPTMSDYERWLGAVQITPVLVPQRPTIVRSRHRRHRVPRPAPRVQADSRSAMAGAPDRR